MKVNQISIFVENKKGRLAEVTQVLGAAGVNIRALFLADTSDFGVLRLIVNNSDLALEVLRKNGITVNKTEVVAVAVPDRPSGLFSVLDPLQRAGVNVEYMYAFVEHYGDSAIVIFRFDNSDEAIRVLTENGIPVLSSDKIYGI
ncbi:MAG: ACT domain-containing protein [Deltaproteobacteria bacterium]|nr:ACT domain-containing protein [Deltaproteobacteria bacterium]